MLGTWKEEAEAPAVKPIYQQKGLPRLGGKTLLLRVGDGGKRGLRVWRGSARLTLVSGAAQCLGVLVSGLDHVSQGTTKLEVLAVPRIPCCAECGLGILKRRHWGTLAECEVCPSLPRRAPLP